MTKCRVEITKPEWSRMDAADGQEEAHPTAFEASGPCTYSVSAETTSDGGVDVECGFTDLRVLKTTGSGFENFPRCEYTTLPEMHDRLLCTSVTASWTFAKGCSPGYSAVASMVREVTLDFFANRYSLSVQQVVYDIGEELLARIPELESVTLILPNIHVFLYDIARFGLENNNEVYYPVDDPAGYIEGTVVRSNKPLSSKL